MRRHHPPDIRPSFLVPALADQPQSGNDRTRRRVMGLVAFHPGGGLWIAELQLPVRCSRTANSPAAWPGARTRLPVSECPRGVADVPQRLVRPTRRCWRDYPIRGETYATLPAPEGYTEAWEERVSRPPAGSYPLRTSIYIRADASGKPANTFRCTARQKVESDQKLCVVQTELERAPSLQIEYAFPSSQWPNHRTIRAAIIGMVDSWRR